MAQIREKVSFNFSTLNSLIETPNSCVFCVKECQRSIFLLPVHLSDLKKSMKEVLDSKVTNYDMDLKGIILAFKNVKIQDSVKFIDNGNIKLDYVADIYLFKPSIGSTLSGKIIKVSKDVLSCLVHKIFNVAIPKTKEFAIKMGQTVNFNVVKLDYTSRLPYIKGELISVAENGDLEENLDESILKNNRKHKLSESDGDFTSPKRPKTELGDISVKKKKKKKDKENVEDLAAKLLSEAENSIKTKDSPKIEDAATEVIEKKKKKKKKYDSQQVNDDMTEILSETANSKEKSKSDKPTESPEETHPKKNKKSKKNKDGTDPVKTDDDLVSQLLSEAEMSVSKKKKKKLENLPEENFSETESKKNIQTKIVDFAVKSPPDLTKKKKSKNTEPDELISQLLSEAEASINVPKEKKKKKKNLQEAKDSEETVAAENFETNLMTLAQVATSPENGMKSKKKKNRKESKLLSDSSEDLVSKLLSEAEAKVGSKIDVPEAKPETKKKKSKLQKSPSDNSSEDLVGKLLSEAEANLESKKPEHSVLEANAETKKSKKKSKLPKLPSDVNSSEDLVSKLLSEAEANIGSKKHENSVAEANLETKKSKKKSKKSLDINSSEDLVGKLLSEAEANIGSKKHENSVSETKKNKKKTKNPNLSSDVNCSEDLVSKLLSEAEANLVSKKPENPSEKETKKSKKRKAQEDLALLSESMNGNAKKQKVEDSVEDLTAQLLSVAEASLVKKKKKKNKKDSIIA